MLPSMTFWSGRTRPIGVTSCSRANDDLRGGDEDDVLDGGVNSSSSMGVGALGEYSLPMLAFEREAAVGTAEDCGGFQREPECDMTLRRR